MPRTKIRGRKTTRVVSVLAMTAATTSRLPFTAADSESWPASRSRLMFSSTTMALSTSIPTPRANPPRVIKLRVNPPKYIKAKVATTEMGMVVAITAVLGIFRRNSTRTNMARAPP